MSDRWRLINHGAGPPDRNMAVDRALLDRAAEADPEPVLRLYWWDPHSLSLGVNQKADGAIDWAALEADGCGAVRRPTGGRAILHAGELTYSVVAPAPPGGITAAYLWLAEGLRGGLAEAGITVEIARMETSAAAARRGGKGAALAVSDPCFSHPGRYELVVEGRKLVGSAQCRHREWFMQHGSILLGDEHLNLPRYLIGGDTEKEMVRLRQATVDCATLLGHPLPAADFAPLFAIGFARALGVTLDEGTLDQKEEERAEQLRAAQFGTTTWTRSARLNGPVGEKDID